MSEPLINVPLDRPSSQGPGNTLGILSLVCLAGAFVVGLIACCMISQVWAQAPANLDGALRVIFRVGIIALVALGISVLGCLLGMLLGVIGLVLALIHPRGRPILPVVGLGLNALPLVVIGVLTLWIWLLPR
jgi:hypothetical protein